MISICAVIGGPEAYIFDAKRTRAANFIAATQVNEGCTVIAAYHMPGSVCKPGYVGTRAGLCDKRLRKAEIQIAVPESVLDDEEKHWKFLLSSLVDAIESAEEVFRRKGIQYDPSQDLLTVAQVQEAVPLDNYGGFEHKYDEIEQSRALVDELIEELGMD